MSTSLRPFILFAGLALAAGVISAQRIEDNDPSLTYQGTWMTVQDPNASAGAYAVSSTVGSSVTFSVVGTNFVLYRKMDTNGGYATVTVDGNPFGNLTFYAQQTVYQVPAAIDELSNATHTIVLTVSQTQPAGSGGNNLYIDALQTPVPANLGPTQPQLDAITRTNYYRTMMALPAARHHLALGLAANAHAKYLSDTNFVANGGSPHVETLGASPDFTAPQPADRDAYFGFTGFAGIEDSNNSPDPIQFVDEWMFGVYHRWLFLVYGLTDAGFGGYVNGSTMDFGSNVAQPAAPNANTMTTYPISGQTDIWPFYDGSDGPNNVTYGGSYGFPISVEFSFPANAVPGTAAAAPTTGTLKDMAGNVIPVTIADNSIDTQLLGAYVMIPTQPLAVSTTYNVTMSGVDPMSNPFSLSWAFTTSNSNAIHDPRARPGNNSYVYTVNWDMPGMGVPSQLEYGPTTAYGNVIPGTFSQGTTFSAQVPGIVTTGTTHFRVTSRDAQGNAYQTLDHTITVSNSVTAPTVGYAQVSPDPQDTSFQWETAGVVASTQVNYGLTTAYGSMIAGNPNVGSPTQFRADLFNPAAGTYHYQITATDAQGNTFTTPDATFVVP
jgi:hypothetical protein